MSTLKKKYPKLYAGGHGACLLLLGIFEYCYPNIRGCEIGGV